jgi:glycerol uptake facilitator-like aquaporin
MSATSEPPHLRRQATSLSLATPFAGRLGGNQEFTLDRNDPLNQDLLRKVPDAAPNLNLKEAFDLRGFREIGLWKASLIEFVGALSPPSYPFLDVRAPVLDFGMLTCATIAGTLIFTFASAWNSLSPNVPPPLPSDTSGPFSRTYFLGPLVANVINAIILALLIFSFGAVSGAHFNPLITVGTFFARLTTFPRMTLYVLAQIGAATLAGLLLRAGANTRDFKVGGCYLFESMGTPVRSAFTVELMADLLLLFLAFGVGLDPRQREIFGPALGPIFVGLTVGGIALLTAYTAPGYGGAGLNAARCFGVFVGSRFPGWHWIHWVAMGVASVGHGLVYWTVPPGSPHASDKPRVDSSRSEKDIEASERRDSV